MNVNFLILFTKFTGTFWKTCLELPQQIFWMSCVWELFWNNLLILKIRHILELLVQKCFLKQIEIGNFIKLKLHQMFCCTLMRYLEEWILPIPLLIQNFTIFLALFLRSYGIVKFYSKVIELDLKETLVKKKDGLHIFHLRLKDNCMRKLATHA